MATTKTIIILARYTIKATGSVVCLVRNGNNKEYCVTINANFTTGCVQANGDACPSTRGKHKCYHITGCQQAEQGRTNREIARADVVRNAPQAFVTANKLTREQYNALFDPNYSYAY